MAEEVVVFWRDSDVAGAFSCEGEGTEEMSLLLDAIFAGVVVAY
jgi:hypothetical protein